MTFGHEPRPHIEYFLNKTEQEAKASLEWEFGILDKAWLVLEGVKKYRIWEVRLQDFILNLEVFT